MFRAEILPQLHHVGVLNDMGRWQAKVRALAEDKDRLERALARAEESAAAKAQALSTLVRPYTLHQWQRSWLLLAWPWAALQAA